MPSTEAIEYSAIARLPYTTVGIVVRDNAISRIDFLKRDHAEKISEDALAKRTIAALEEYGKNPAYQFSLPIDLQGTAFQLSVWRALQALQSGETISYSGLATKLNSGARAIGNACRNNPIPLIIPCHRVVAKNGLGGFSGDSREGWTELKKWLLHHEGAL